MMERQTLGGEQEENILVQHCIKSFGGLIHCYNSGIHRLDIHGHGTFTITVITGHL